MRRVFFHKLVCIVICALAALVPGSSGAADSRQFSRSMPPSFAGLPVKDGGRCEIDALNFALFENSPMPLRRGASLALAGWAVVDVRAGTIGAARAVQVGTDPAFFVSGESYVRNGLGAALGNPALDRGGFKVERIALNIAPGSHRLFILILSGKEVLRCDTRRVLRVE
ncbi:MAG: hypothetical protein JNM79_18155 [Burkholderiales bacterium]|nr:hypothetical protein [Burkholderiales bacterium]